MFQKGQIKRGLGLYRTFRNKKDVNELIRNLMTLPLMDVPAIYRLFETLKKIAKRGRLQSIDKLFEYVKRYWVDGVFTPEDWSCYGYDIRTNNEIECWNGRLWKEAKTKAQNIYNLANLLYKDATKALRDMHRLESKYTKASQKRIEAKIQAAYTDYMNGTKPLDTLISLAKATEKVCYYERRSQEGTGDSDAMLIAHFEGEEDIQKNSSYLYILCVNTL